MPPLASRRAQVDPERYRPIPPAAPTISPPPPMDDALTRSPVMLASLPGSGSGPDAVLRQFNGGRRVPKSRLLVP